jgi:hypothetical protein
VAINSIVVKCVLSNLLYTILVDSGRLKIKRLLYNLLSVRLVMDVISIEISDLYSNVPFMHPGKMQ